MQSENCSSGSACGCSGIERRDFLRLAGVGSLLLLSSRRTVMAGPFDDDKVSSAFESIVPSDKKLSAQWLRSLFERGTPKWYRGDELRFIGMPVGGMCAGQLYLGGDGKLWHWDIFNRHIGTGDGHYANPPLPDFPVQQGFALQMSSNGQTQTRTLDKNGFSNISFLGQYPIGTVEYRDSASPLEVTLEAFSPFIPLNTDDSSLPATILHFTLKNNSPATVEATLSGWLENAVCLDNRGIAATRHNSIKRETNFTWLDCSVEPLQGEGVSTRPDILFENWDKNSYEGWTVEGTAFGARPVKRSEIMPYQGDVGGEDENMVNTHASAPGTTVEGRDANVGKLTGRPFTIERNFLNFWLGGGNHPGQIAFNLLIDGKIVLGATGSDSNTMRRQTFDVRAHQGQTAHIEIIDNATGPWGQIGVGRITFSDKPNLSGKLEELPDFGTMGLALLGAPAQHASAQSDNNGFGGAAKNEVALPLSETSIGALGRTFRLAPNASNQISFVIAWHFPNLQIEGLGRTGRYYATQFASAREVAQYVAREFPRLSRQTRLWRDVWYDSTLPYWFLDRTFLNASIPATATCMRFEDGRFYAWEGVGCCPGTCTHVWHYAQSLARLFPELERDTRERVDLGVAMNPYSGVMGFRAEFDRGLAVDGQAGTILRLYREHQMTGDNAFLQRNWPRIQKTFVPLLKLDEDENGVMQGAQMNTLDAPWFGKISWLSSLYVAALRAGAEMARDMNDLKFAARCEQIAARGTQEISAQLFNGEYFISRPDPNHPEANNSGSGCEIDQVLGQSWAWQTHLGRVLPANQTKAALAALYRYNFTPDAGRYRETHKPGRWYAMAGEAGLLMCTFPRADWSFEKASGIGTDGKPNFFAGYFNECMNGFEYQAAGHMVWEGLVTEGLAVTRAIHDRYGASRRNPWNEVECGDHYARSMASHGVYIAACGYEYHGPRGHLGFAPKITPENFRCAFTAAQGWGTFSQKIQPNNMTAEIALSYENLLLKTVSLEVPDSFQGKKVKANLDKRNVPLSSKVDNGRLMITFNQKVQMKAGQKLVLNLV